MKEFAVVRICNKTDGSAVAPVRLFDTEVEAYKEFYRLCGLAVDSEHFTDTVLIMNRRGLELEDPKTFEHMPEPEPEEHQQQ